MKQQTSFIFALLLISICFLPNSFAQNSSQWHLPDSAVARLGKGSIVDITYAPNGTHFAVVSTIGIWLYDARTYKETALLTGHTWEEVSTIAFSLDGKTLASGGGDGTIVLWEVPSEMPEDVNGDGSVNIDDLMFVAARLGHVGEGAAADVNGDGVVNILDLVAVAGAVE